MAKLGVKTPFDLLEHYPMRYEDFSDRRLIADVQSGEVVTVAGVITSMKARPIPGRKLTIIEGVITDATGSLNLVWFNQKFLMTTLTPGTRVLLSGTVEWQKKGLQMKSPAYEIQRSGESTHTGRIVPIYPLTGSLTQKRLRTAIKFVLSVGTTHELSSRAVHEPPLQDWLPSDVCEREKLVDLASALKQIHFPESEDLRQAARRRLQFNELFLYELSHLRSRAELKKLPAPAIPEAIDEVKKFVGELPFELTGAQRKSAWQILQDMALSEPMNRLLEGDVGSGKTLVAAIAAVSASASGFQTAVLAPTEILAEQHAKTFQKYLGKRLRIGLITRTHGKELVEDVGNGELDLIVGTHALLEEKIAFCRLGLVVVDEQHRFGVAQRQRLRDKQMEDGGLPHLLSMTATPIPRTLALTLYGDLDISVLDEMPKGRKAIKTTLIRQGEDPFDAIRAELDAGRQAFFVCPLIDASDEIEAKSVTELAESLKKGPLKGYKLATLHGRMKSEEKQNVMEEFVKGKFDVLVSTTVIEVGVDVPNATVMFVEGAERFGLAQLHQLRGRVGRSDMPSYCYLRPSGFVPEATYARLRALVECQNGFELAERDLALRGPGDVYGTMQSGFEGFKLADLFNAPLISAARNEAAQLLKNDPTFADHPALLARLGEYVRRIHFE